MNADLLPTSQEGKLDRLVEECAEVIQVICKGRRFGWEPREFDGVCYDNALELVRELQDLTHAITMLTEDFPRVVA